jgi:glucose-6-phosphate 1-epimerase
MQPRTPTPGVKPGRVIFLDGNGNLPKVEVVTSAGRGELYLHGAHVTHFEKNGEPPLLFLSPLSRFQADQPIRGGIPVIFPWFGARDGEPMHGFARITTWDLREIMHQPDGALTLRLGLPQVPETALLPPFDAEYLVTFGETLEIELRITNRSSDQDFPFENCLHTYFLAGDIDAVAIAGLRGADYLDKTGNFARQTETAEVIRITKETDRVYMNTTATVEITDRKLGREIRIEKCGSNSTVVWNPWIAKSQQMPDLGNDDYLRFICVESGNVGENRLVLSPGESAALKLKISLKSSA